MQKRYLNTQEAADYLTLNKSNLEHARVDGRGPKFLVLGEKRIAYDVRDLDEWAQARRQDPLKRAPRAAKRNASEKEAAVVG